uniref:Putative ovule protein n=1 Tax=Solanum chacoense TaxID=4108 RepID=A0A0V0GIT5_SOLCH
MRMRSLLDWVYYKREIKLETMPAQCKTISSSTRRVKDEQGQQMEQYQQTDMVQVWCLATVQSLPCMVEADSHHQICCFANP